MTASTVPPQVDAAATEADQSVHATPKAARRFALPAWSLGLVGAAVALAVGLVVVAIPMTLIWMTVSQAGLSWSETLRGSLLLLAVVHGTPVVIGSVAYSLVPWGFVVLPAALLAGSAGWAARRSKVGDYRRLAVLVATMSVGYALAAAALSRLAELGPANVTTLSTFVHALAVAVIATGIGALRAADAALPVSSTTLLVATVLRAAAIGVLSLLGIGAVAGAAFLVAHVDEAIEMTQSLHPGAWGGLLLLLVGLGYVPVLVVWSTSYVLGAGVVIGPAIVASPFVSTTAPTQLPPFPLLAAIPESAAPIAWALPALGIVAGVLVGLTISRRARQESRLLRLGMAAGAALVVGVVMAVLAFLASGSLGDLRLAAIGTVPSTVGILAAVLAILGAVPAAVAAPSTERPKLRPTTPTMEQPTRGDDDV